MSGDSPQSVPASRRIRYLDSCRGVIIILMVAGHYKPAQSPETWLAINELIHTFRMPTLFFLSGYLFLAELTRNGDAGIGPIVKKKATRLLIPCACIAAAYILIKLILPLFMRIGQPLTRDTLFNIVCDPVKSYVPILWFLQALFIMFTLFLLLRVKLRLGPHLIFVLFFFLAFIQFPLYFAFDSAVKNMQFFTLGFLVNLHSLDKRIERKFLLIAAPVFIVNAVFLTANQHSLILQRISAYSGLISMVFIAMVLSESSKWIPVLIEKAGFHSMGIYILHPYFLGAMVVLWYRVITLPDNLFVLGLVTAVLIAVVASAFIDKYLLRRYAFTRKFILGMPR